MKSTFEKMGGTYTLGADGIYYPNLVSTDEEPHYGKYGMIRKTYLKEHRPAMYSLYMLEDRLTEHLNAVDDETQEKMDTCRFPKRSWALGVWPDGHDAHRRRQPSFAGTAGLCQSSPESIFLGSNPRPETEAPKGLRDPWQCG